MIKIKQQFSDLRKTTPKHIQWLLLAAAFIVVLILLTLLLTGGRNKETIQNTDDIPVKLNITPDVIDWADTPVDERRTETIKVSANGPVKIMAVRDTKSISGFEHKETCPNMGEINDKISCTITVDYVPTAAATAEGNTMFIDWRGANESDAMVRTDKIIVTLGAVAPAAPVNFIEPEPEPEIVVPEPIPEPAPIKSEIVREIETIAPSDPFADNNDDDDDFIITETVQPLPPVSSPVTNTPARAETCSDFAFAGYNSTGNQIGWIKPEGGAYYFHPFSDKNCDTPTGIYNPDNGIITSIDGSGQKIGTDAEHIGQTTISLNGTIPQLSNAPAIKKVNRARQLTTEELSTTTLNEGMGQVLLAPAPVDVSFNSSGDTVQNTQPFDRSFILRQYKPIPATIVSDIRADVEALKNNTLPVRATVDRNVYADNGRTVIIPAGTLLMGYVTGTLPGPYTTIGRMDIRWYQFILPSGVEFNFQEGQDPFSADAQGRTGVPGRGSTDYLEQFVMPMLTAIVPAAVNMIAPVADKFVNQIDLDNNTVVQSGTLRSSELAKNEIITAWNQVAQKLMVDMMENTVPPFSIAAGTRITVYSPVDLQVTCGTATENPGKKCAITEYSSNRRRNVQNNAIPDYEDGSWVGQVRSFNWAQYCEGYANGRLSDEQTQAVYDAGLDYSSVLFYCQSNQYKAINNARQDALFKNQKSASNQNSVVSMGGVGTTAYNENVLGLQYADEDKTQIVNPFLQLPTEEVPTITCEDGANPDANGCCTGEIYTDMGDQGFNCCPETGGDCFPPIQ